MHALNTLKFGHLILRKIIKFVPTRCRILRLKCTKFNFGWGSAPDPLPQFKGPTSKGGEGVGMGSGGETEQGGRGGDTPGCCLHPPWYEILDKTLASTDINEVDACCTWTILICWQHYTSHKINWWVASDAINGVVQLVLSTYFTVHNTTLQQSSS